MPPAVCEKVLVERATRSRRRAGRGNPIGVTRQIYPQSVYEP